MLLLGATKYFPRKFKPIFCHIKVPVWRISPFKSFVPTWSLPWPPALSAQCRLCFTQFKHFWVWTIIQTFFAQFGKNPTVIKGNPIKSHELGLFLNSLFISFTQLSIYLNSATIPIYLNCECHSISIPKHNLESDSRQQQEDFNKAHSFVHKIRYWGNVSIVSNYQILPQKTRQATDWETLDILLSDGKSRFIDQWTHIRFDIFVKLRFKSQNCLLFYLFCFRVQLVFFITITWR